MNFGTQDKDFFPEPFTEKFQAIKEMGFDCLEIDGKVLLDHQSEIKTAMAASGLTISSACGGYRGWIGDFIEEKRLLGVADLKQIIAALKAVGGTGVVIPAAWGMFTYRLPPMISPRSQKGDNLAILASLKELEVTAKEYGIYLYLEPLNRYQDHMLNLVSDAAAIIDQGNFEMVKITADFYHMAIEEDDISETLVRYKDYIGHIHIAENHRYQPGSGAIDFKRHIKTLKEIGFQGAVINEGRVRGADPVQAYRDSVTYMKQFL
jgi:sugar phosphate isomerase/epimerase